MLDIHNTKVCLYRGTHNGAVYEYMTVITPDGEFMFVVDGEEIVITGPIGNAAEGELVAEFNDFAEAEASGGIPGASTSGGSRVRSARKPRRKRSVV